MIWDEIGESDTDRHNMFNQLEQECHEIYRKKVEETRKHKAGLIKWLADAESEVTIIAPSLGDSVSRVRFIGILFCTAAVSINTASVIEIFLMSWTNT
jgi:protein regulator of cytokinesis 1